MLLAALTAVIPPVIAVSWLLSLVYSNVNSEHTAPAAWRWIVSLLVPVCLALYGVKKKSLNHSGAAAGLIVGFFLSISCMRFMVSLLTFFILGSKVTKLQAEKKRKIEADFKEGGQRNWIQVISNGGPAAALAVFYLMEAGATDVPIDFSKKFLASWYSLAVLSALACSCGDTFASEIGTAYSASDPVLVLNFKKVPRGTNGGISLVGSVSSILGGFVVAASFYVMELLLVNRTSLLDSPPQWPLMIYGAVAGLFGSLVDSVLGATLQYSGRHRKTGMIVEYTGPDVDHISGTQILDNHSVNLISSLVTGLTIPTLAAQTWSLFS